MKKLNKFLFGTDKISFRIYNRETLAYHPISKIRFTLLCLLFFSIIAVTSYEVGKYFEKQNMLHSLSDYEKLLIVAEADPFSKEAFIQMLKDLNVKYPHIVMAQSMLETGKWKSDIFIENHNLFGMKLASRRITTAEGTNRNHAYYNHWRESVYDYAFYQCKYLSQLKSEHEYFQYLSASYAEDPNYIASVKIMIEKNNLKELFK